MNPFGRPAVAIGKTVDPQVVPSRPKRGLLPTPAIVRICWRSIVTARTVLRRRAERRNKRPLRQVDGVDVERRRSKFTAVEEGSRIEGTEGVAPEGDAC